MVPFLSYTTPIIIKNVASPADAKPQEVEGPKYGVKYGAKYQTPNDLKLNPTIKSYDTP
jgi:hypothetical protein